MITYLGGLLVISIYRSKLEPSKGRTVGPPFAPIKYILKVPTLIFQDLMVGATSFDAC